MKYRKTKMKSREITDAFWDRAKALLPQKQRDPGREYKRRAGRGRSPLDYRRVLEGIFYVLRTGIQWKALPKEKFGSPSSIHAYFQAWERDGFFLRLWKAGQHEYDEAGGIAREWH